MGFELLEHSADLGFEASGSDLHGAIDQAVAALGAILAGPEVGQASQRRSVELSERDPEALVVSLLSECLYLLEVQAWLARGAQLVLGPDGARGTLRGEPYDPMRHDGTDVKAITWHQLAVRETPRGTTITVYVDC